MATAFLLAGTPAHASEMVIFVAENSVVQNMSLDDLSDIYLGEITYVGNEKLTPVFFVEGNDARADFLREVLHVSNNVYKTHWMKRIFREGGVPPLESTSEVSAINAIMDNPGGVGFVYASVIEKIPGTRELLRLHLE